MLYLPISRNWIVSRIAVRTYFHLCSGSTVPFRGDNRKSHGVGICGLRVFRVKRNRGFVRAMPCLAGYSGYGDALYRDVVFLVQFR